MIKSLLAEGGQSPPTTTLFFCPDSSLLSTPAQQGESPETRPSCCRRRRGCKCCEVWINQRTRGVRTKSREIPRSQFKGVELSCTTNSNSKHHTHYTFDTRYSILGDFFSSPEAEDHNNANIEDRWVPNGLWLWTASRIKWSTDSKQLKQS